MRAKHGKEYFIQRDLIAYLKVRGWLVERIVGLAWQYGLPDLFIAHKKWGQRWVDVKVERKYSFTKAQKIKWPLWELHNIGIWILTGADQANYDKLFSPPNWRQYVKKAWNIPTQQDIDNMLEKLR